MRVLVGPEKKAVPSDILLRVVLRSDLTPVPETVEVTVRDDPDFRWMWQEDSEITVGRDASVFRIVKDGLGSDSGLIQGPRKLGTIPVTGIAASCAAITMPLQRAVVREGTSFGDIYRACGATAPVESNVPVPRFSSFVGDIPSFAVAVIMQEEATVPMMREGRIAFKRLTELVGQKPIATLPEAADRTEQSQFKERHQVPFGYSVDDTGAVIFGRKESGRAAIYLPRSDTRVLNNLSVALIRRKYLQSDFSPDILAGHSLQIGDKSYVVITAAHVWDTETGGQTQYSKFWVGEVVR